MEPDHAYLQQARILSAIKKLQFYNPCTENFFFQKIMDTATKKEINVDNKAMLNNCK